MNALDILLSINQDKFKREEKEVELTRLSNLAGDDTKVIFKIQSITIDEHGELLEQWAEDALNFKIHTLLKGVIEPNLKDKNLLEKYEVKTPKELIKKILKPGELNLIYSSILELSGASKDMVKEIKN